MLGAGFRYTRISLVGSLLSLLPACLIAFAIAELLPDGPYDGNGLVFGFVALVGTPAVVVAAALWRAGAGSRSALPLVLQAVAIAVLLNLPANGWLVFVVALLVLPIAGLCLDRLAPASESRT